MTRMRVNDEARMTNDEIVSVHGSLRVLAGERAIVRRTLGVWRCYEVTFLMLI